MKVKVQIASLSRYDLEGDIDLVIQTLWKVKKQADADGLEKVRVDFEEGYDNIMEVIFTAQRDETAVELHDRLAQEEKSKQNQLDYVKRQAEQLGYRLTPEGK